MRGVFENMLRNGRSTNTSHSHIEQWNTFNGRATRENNFEDLLLFEARTSNWSASS